MTSPHAQWSTTGAAPPLHLRDPQNVNQTRCGLSIPSHAWETPQANSRPCRRCARSSRLDEAPHRPRNKPPKDPLPEKLRIKLDRALCEIIKVALTWSRLAPTDEPSTGAGFRTQTLPSVLAWTLGRANGTAATTGAIKYLRSVGYSVGRRAVKEKL